MKIEDLYAFVTETDVSKNKNDDQRERIATLGLVSEIGSILSALKKGILADASKKDETARHHIRGELKEEIGDALWYAVMLAHRLDDQRAKDIFSADITMLQRQLTSRTRNDKRVQKELGSLRQKSFLKAAKTYQRKRKPTVDHYQETAYHTRRTDDEELRNVCAAVLQQLAAQLSRDFLPNLEMALNHEVRPKDPVNTLGEIAWHLAALASIYELRFSDILLVTKKKAEFRNPKNLTGPRHNIGWKKGERFPEKFEIHFRDIGKKRTQMHWVEGRVVKKTLGNPLTDNNYRDDGYRFHDVLHAAFAVHLGWSPILREFMGLKRRSKRKIDEIEDGGRAKILEETIALQIHLQTESLRKSLSDAGKPEENPYAHQSALSFEFLRILHELTEGHEVYKNPKQDWDKAIRQGYKFFKILKDNNGGIIIIDTKKRNMKFKKLPQKTTLDYDNPEIPSKKDDGLCKKCRSKR